MVIVPIPATAPRQNCTMVSSPGQRSCGGMGPATLSLEEFDVNANTNEQAPARRFGKDPDAIAKLSPEQYRVTQQGAT